MIDTSIILLILAILSLPVLNLMTIRNQAKRDSDTSAHMLSVDAAIKQYFFQNGFYPCPANPTLSEKQTDYGTALFPCNDPDSPDPAIGGVPFKDLKIPAGTTIDGYKNKIVYAVSKNLTAGDASFAAGGTLNLLYTRKNMLTVPPTLFDDASLINGHYVLLSYGKDGRGGYAASGKNLDSCPSAAIRESENCDGDTVFLFQENNIGHVGGANYYDDRTLFQESVPTRIWMNSESDPSDIFTTTGFVGIGTESPLFHNDDFLRYEVNQISNLWEIVGVDPSTTPPTYLVANRNPGNVGIGIQAPEKKLDIAGNLKTGTLRAKKFCDTASGNCMPR